jgi:hypothetical protein
MPIAHIYRARCGRMLTLPCGTIFYDENPCCLRLPPEDADAGGGGNRVRWQTHPGGARAQICTPLRYPEDP